MVRHTFEMQPLEPRTLLAMLPVGIDPANMGKGDWVWLVDSARQNVGASSVQGLVDYLKNKGMKWIIVKAGDGNDGPFESYTQFNKDLIDRVHKAGMKIFGYHFIYGGGDPSPKVATTTPEGERGVAKEIMSLNPDGLIIDAEGQYERAPNKLTSALAYGKSFKDAYPGKLLGHAPFPYVSFHRAFPYYEFGKYSDVIMPQAYWKTISIAQTPEKMHTDMEREWHALYDEFRATGKADAVKPIVPIGQGYDPGAKVTPGDEVTRWVNLLKSDTDPASPGGYNGVSFWSVQHHTPSIWSAVGSASIGKATGKINGTVFNDADLDGVRDAGEAGIANRTVYIDADNDSVLDANELRTTTDSSGNYSLFHLTAGTYKVRHVLGSGYRQTSPSNNFGHTVTLSAGEIETGKNFGATSKAQVTGTAFFDTDGDGGRDSDEGTLAGVRVYDDVDRDGVWDSNEPSALSNSTGTYRLNLSTGAKRLRYVVPSGYRGTAPASGFHDVTLSAGQVASGRNFGATQRIIISGAVYNDFNENKIRDAGDTGLPGFRVYIDLDNDSRWDSNEASVFSDTSGNWKFTTLSAGTYYVKVEARSGYRRTTQSTFLIVLGPGGVATNKLFGEKRIV